MKKFNLLLDWFADKGSVLISLSGGVDSGLVALAAFLKLKDSALAVTADYKTLANEELNSARKITSEIGIKHIIINYNELENQDFVRNDMNRCFYCRFELGDKLLKVAKKYQIKTIVDGTNIDDLGDYRPGIKALRKKNIQSPLVETGFKKKDIRFYAKKMGLSIHDKPSNSCLASRIPWGTRVTAEKLARIEMGELLVRQAINVKQVRVRDLNGMAKIEIDSESLKKISNKINFSKLQKNLKLIGFSSAVIDPEGYRPGKINVMAD